MKKILLLGGSQSQIPAINKAKEMGLYVITCDYLENNPGHKLAHEYHNVSTTDKEAVLALAKQLKIDGIVSYASDPGAPTQAYVAEKLGLPSHPYQSVEILSNKDLFREFQKQNNFPVPKAQSYESFEEAMNDIDQFKLPIMIKPVDSSGSKGVSKIYSFDLLYEKVNEALRYSRVKRFIIEEYIESYGYQVDGEGFSINGELVFRSFSNTHFPISNVNPFVSIGSSWPLDMPEQIQNRIHDEIQKVLSLLNMKTGPYNFNIRVGEDGNVYIIEMGAISGGMWQPQIVQITTGIDLVEYTIKAAMGEDCSDLNFIESSEFWSTYILNSQTSGTFKGIAIDEEFEKNYIKDY
ncbi:ATP-grasp domain-containing protein [Lysinibacillus endophyticus]